MNTEEYIDRIKVNKDPFVEIYNSLQVPEETIKWVDGLSNPVNLAVFTADWCGDAVSTTPVVLKLADSSDNVNLQVLAATMMCPWPTRFFPSIAPGPSRYSWFSTTT